MPAGECAQLAAEALREHIRRLLLDWPCLLGHPAPGVAEALRACPLFGAAAKAHNGDTGAAEVGDWIAHALMGQDGATWLAGWRRDPQGWLESWSRESAALPALMLRTARADACAIGGGCPPLLPHANADGLRALAAELALEADFERAPAVSGVPRETGSWTRLAQAGDAGLPIPANAWLRMGARLAEVCALGEELAHGAGQGVEGRRLLTGGALVLAPGVALAWTEMARGLLCHWVQLDLDGPRAVIRDYRIVAPTEWNFHPRGAVAQALAAMPAGGDADTRVATARRIGVLAAAFDPCVNFEIEFAHA
jgi:hypothetical protein